jgi:RNA polymerase sigma-70 factor (sigma-E family)
MERREAAGEGTVHRLRSGSARREFERFVADATDRLYRTAYLMTWDASESEDLVQETFLKVARRWPRVRLMTHPYAFARRILVNLVFDSASRRSRHRLELAGHEDLDLPVDDSARAALEQVDDAQLLERALAALTRRQRMVLVLRYWEDLTEAEVASSLGCSVGTVKSTASRAAARLAQEMTLHNPAPLTLLSPTTGGTPQ